MKKMLTAISLLILFALTHSCSPASRSKDTVKLKTMAEIAQDAKLPQGAPKYSDVCFSSRSRHPFSPKDPHDTFRDASSFHATRLDWVYSTDSKWIEECKERGYNFGGALSSILPDSLQVRTREKGRLRNINGDFVTAPWMKTWKTWWACVNSPEYRKTYIEHAKAMIDGGADVLHMDDSALNWGAMRFDECCYCVYCKKKAKESGVNLAKEMKSFQKKSVEEFYNDVRSEINKYAKRYVPMSSNNFQGKWDVFPYYLFDYGIAECTRPTPVKLVEVMNDIRNRGKAQVFTLRSDDVEMYRRSIALTYSCGMQMVVPWDVYMTSGAKRLFGTPEDYADL